MREQAAALKATARAELKNQVKSLSESIFVQISTVFNANDVMDGETVRLKMKECLRTTAAEALANIGE